MTPIYTWLHDVQRMVLDAPLDCAGYPVDCSEVRGPAEARRRLARRGR